MRTLVILIVSIICLSCIGCATNPNINLSVGNNQVAKNYGLYLDPIDPSGKHQPTKLHNQEVQYSFLMLK